MAKRKRPAINLAKKKAPPPHSGDLEMLFGTEDDTEQASGMTLLAIRVDAIAPDPEQPRKYFAEESLRELSNSIAEDGLIQPIEVTQVGKDKYMIVHGERRWRASQLAGLKTIPAVVRRRDYDEVTRFVRQIVENVQREDLNEMDRADSLIRLKELMTEEQSALAATKVDDGEKAPPWANTVSWADVGRRLGYSRQRINQIVSLLKLSTEIQDDVREGKISERDTRVYQGLESNQQVELHEEIMAGNLTKEQAKQVTKIVKSEPNAEIKPTVERVRKAPHTSKVSQPNKPIPDPIIDEPPEREHILITRLKWAREHLSTFEMDKLTADDRAEAYQIITAINKDSLKLMEAIENYNE